MNIQVNFQSSGSPVPTGYVEDTGAAYGNRGNGYTYGWDSANSENRNCGGACSSNQAYDTLNHMQKSGANHSWEIAVPNGTYNVTIAGGDPSYIDSTIVLDVEGVTLANGTSCYKWVEGSGSVTVNDRRLTVTNGSGSSNNKINFIHIVSQ